jgi:hypothetical protein
MVASHDQLMRRIRVDFANSLDDQQACRPTTGSHSLLLEFAEARMLSLRTTAVQLGSFAFFLPSRRPDPTGCDSLGALASALAHDGRV